jgi:hypothetical protein
MRKIAALNVLLRMRVVLPEGLKVTTEEFGEGWDLMRTGDVERLKEGIQARGWNFIKIAYEPRRSGVGETPEEAIRTALRLSLRRISEHFNVVEVDRIELAEYPWFFLARVMLCPYRIQKDAVPTAPEEALSHPIVPPQRRLPTNSPELYPAFGAVIPRLKEMLVLSRSTEGRAQ